MTHALYNPDAGDLLYARLCDPRCLLAMESPPGDASSCSCACGGRWHAALVGASVLPQPWTCHACGAVAEDCARGRAETTSAYRSARVNPPTPDAGRCCADCGHPTFVLAAAHAVLDELAATEAAGT